MNLSIFQTLKKLEESLWITETRFNTPYMDEILAADFFEYGRSGKIYTRAETMSHPYQKIEVKLPLEKFELHRINRDVYQATYISEVGKDKLRANRSSIWLYSNEKWQLKFHQGTPTK